jgi:DNA helicase II / ATP-dependent DNA helicase PcrA
MPSSENRAIIATAGSGKTAEVVTSALEVPSDEAVLITTYTNRNVAEITKRLREQCGYVPPNISVLGWFSFLISQGSKPYQRALIGEPFVISGLNFMPRPNRYVAKADARDYYLDAAAHMYRDHVSDFVLRLNEATAGAVMTRLERVYAHVFIDEVQDLVAYDLDFLHLLLESECCITMVGDPRQYILETNVGSRNKKYRGAGLLDWFKERSDICQLDERGENYRCNQEICDFADSIFPSLPPATSVGVPVTGHDGIHYIRRDDVLSYMKEHPDATVLRRDRRSDTLGLPALNFGLAKGATFDRVVVFPTANMREFITGGSPDDLKEPQKLYVAATRARYSVALVLD